MRQKVIEAERLVHKYSENNAELQHMYDKSENNRKIEKNNFEQDMKLIEQEKQSKQVYFEKQIEMIKEELNHKINLLMKDKEKISFETQKTIDKLLSEKEKLISDLNVISTKSDTELRECKIQLANITGENERLKECMKVSDESYQQQIGMKDKLENEIKDVKLQLESHKLRANNLQQALNQANEALTMGHKDVSREKEIINRLNTQTESVS